MQPYITPNPFRVLAAVGIHINLPVIHPALSAGGGGGSEPGGGDAVMPLIRTYESGTGTAVNASWTVPATAEEDDLVIATISADNFSAIPLASGAPVGWNLISLNEESIPNIITLWGIVGTDGVVAGGTPHIGLGASSVYMSTCIAVSGANTDDPIAFTANSPDAFNQMSTFDPTSTTTRYYGRNVFITRPGVRAIPTLYDESLVLHWIAMDGDQRSVLPQVASGYENVYQLTHVSNQALSCSAYQMPNVGLTPAFMLHNQNSDASCGFSLVINPATKASGTIPESGPYIANYTTRYLATATQPITMGIPSGAQAGDLAVVVVAQRSNGSFITPTCVDDEAATSWTRDLYWFSASKGWAVWSKELTGNETTVTYDSNSNAYQQASCLLIKGHTSGVLPGAGTSGVSATVISNNILGPSLGVHADGTITIHAMAYHGASNNNLQGSWDQFGIPNPDQPGQDVSGIYMMAGAGLVNSIASALAVKYGTGSGVLAPRWCSAASGPLDALAFSIY